MPGGRSLSARAFLAVAVLALPACSGDGSQRAPERGPSTSPPADVAEARRSHSVASGAPASVGPSDPPPTVDSRVPSVPDLPDDPEELRRFIRERKLVPGWTATDTPNFILLTPAEVNATLVRLCGDTAEALRRDVLQSRFPVDDAAARDLVIRICKDREQYLAYGGPADTSGYASEDGVEIVVFQDQAERKATVRHVQELLCAVHLRSALGRDAGAGWFREGFEGWAGSLERRGGAWVTADGPTARAEAARWKRARRPPRLGELLTWDGAVPPAAPSLADLDASSLRALATDLVTWLVESPDPSISAIPTRYYAALVAGGTRATALAEVTRGVDLRRLEAAWLAD